MPRPLQEYIATGFCVGGRLHFWNLAKVVAALAGFPDREPLTIRVELARAVRSDRANRYYFGVVLKRIAAVAEGSSIDELHEWAKARFLAKHLAVIDHNGEVFGDLVVGGSTRHLTPHEFYEYIERIRQFAAETLTVDIPDPDPNWRFKTTWDEEKNQNAVSLLC